MKIGILTYHAVCNFGANLQALSTICYLKNNGHEPVIINWMTEELDNSYKRAVSEEQYNAHFSFREKCFPMTRRCYNENDIVNVIQEEKIEAVIVGSDAVVQHHPFLSRIVFPSKRIISIKRPYIDTTQVNPFWGSFYGQLKYKIPMAMMSVSCQNTAYRLIPQKEVNILNKLLLNFSYITVRDDWTANMIKYITDKKISPEVTPDPVFAFNDNVKSQLSKEYITEKFNLPEKYILVSFLHNGVVSYKWMEIFKQEALRRGYECVVLPFPNGINFKHPFKYEIKLPISPLEWYCIIKYSKGYVGNNMHPIVVCLHNAIPCFSFDHYGVVRLRMFVNEKTSKIYHIMKNFSVLKNRISCATLINHRNITPNEVFNLLSNFDVEHVKTLSKKYSNDYSMMMKEILLHLEYKKGL